MSRFTTCAGAGKSQGGARKRKEADSKAAEGEQGPAKRGKGKGAQPAAAEEKPLAVRPSSLLALEVGHVDLNWMLHSNQRSVLCQTLSHSLPQEFGLCSADWRLRVWLLVR